MASTSEFTYGSKLQNAEQVLIHLQSFTNYVAPAADQSTGSLQLLITQVKARNSDAAGDRETYSVASDTRQKIFLKDADSMAKLLSPIGAAVRSVFGKDSKEAALITALVIKIRGKKISKGAKDPDAVSVSQSERSFGSLTQSFADILATLDKFGGRYKPANEKIAMAALSALLERLTTANTAVTVAFGALKQTRDNRFALYKTLATLVQRIKDAVKSQYGNSSTEYALIKGLKV